ncbi:LysR family transcriptional regulator [Marivita hallyeonensis]|uniref:Transcriptional regulator, LysR family n=1 Tax=Marivita hallyeonensis TaxID=996342 RepID=A0A1M5NPH7_9RHOB|nr:LysR family transcriptional regulator [Marivita hallyeonensis]SHG91432.1 transcriptional regulator, LysR family [Marivita hallyeonensis]
MDQLNDLSVFVAVAETSSFTAAAQRLGVTSSGTSKSVGRLEARLGVRLFTRTTRRVALTEEGERFYTRARSILDDIAEAETEVQDSQVDLRGRVRIDMPSMLGQLCIVPLLLDFKRANPGVDLDMRFNDQFSDLVEQGVDLALRIGELTDSSLRARKVMETRWITCAAPAYIEARGMPKEPNDLHHHECATYIFKGSGRPFQWRFASEHGSLQFEPPQHLCVNDGNAYLAVARSGLAIVQDLSFNVAADLKAGTLVHVLSDYTAIGPPISLVYPEGRHLPRRVRAVFEFLAQELSG